MNRNQSSSVSLEPSQDPVIRRAHRILAMVGELHKAGFQRLRVAAGMAPSGCHWRSRHHTDRQCWPQRLGTAGLGRGVASYSTANEDRYFGWDDARHDSARQLAAKFIERFPDIAERGVGEDAGYAGWYVRMLGEACDGNCRYFTPTMNCLSVTFPPPPLPDGRGVPQSGGVD